MTKTQTFWLRFSFNWFSFQICQSFLTSPSYNTVFKFQLVSIGYEGAMAVMDDNGYLQHHLNLPEGPLGTEIREKYDAGDYVMVRILQVWRRCYVIVGITGMTQATTPSYALRIRIRRLLENFPIHSRRESEHELALDSATVLATDSWVIALQVRRQRIT